MSSRAEDTEYLFVCPDCDESLTVNESMMVALLEKGCVICGADLSETSFSATAPHRSD
ncbi:MAG: hypothetical protein ABEI96_04295 [Haloarculaceae archaeon]